MIEMLTSVIRVFVGVIAFVVCVLFFLYGVSLILSGLRSAKKRDWDYFCLCLFFGLIIMGSSGVFAWLATLLIGLG